MLYGSPSPQMFGNAVNWQTIKTKLIMLPLLFTSSPEDSKSYFLSVIRKRALTLPVCSSPFNFSKLQQDTSSCLPMLDITRGRSVCACMVTRVHVCCGRPGQVCACTDTPLRIWCEQLGCCPSHQVCCLHTDLAQTHSLSWPQGLALENQLLGRALTMNQLFVLVLRGWAGIAAGL